MTTNPQATQRPGNHKVPAPKAKQPTPPKLPYELACEEQAIARALGPIDVGSKLDACLRQL